MVAVSIKQKWIEQIIVEDLGPGVQVNIELDDSFLDICRT